MGNRAEQFSRGTIESGRTRIRHSMNQKVLKGMGERQGKYFHPDGKEAKAERRRWEQERFLQNFPKYQFDRACGHVFDETATPEDINYVLKNIDKFAHRINGNSSEATGATITIVDFTRVNVLSKEESNRVNPLEQDRLAS